MPQSKLAHYEVLALLGRGGMGEVHRALDTKLGREVALKLLPEDFARDAERLARFQREAKVLASLNHPNIASIYGLEEADGRLFLAMELADGSDLSARISRGPLPEDEVLEIAAQIAAGLEEAHEKGVVHRDLKPANIMVGPDGKVKILDFGLARAFAGESAEEEENIHNSPTITATMSRGVILGTAAYMSPEQARGKTVDRRADIWSFGLVVFELLTGKRMFDGETISDTLAAVLRADLDWDSLPENTSPGMRRLLERCLERDPLRRLRDVGEARIFLESGAQDSSILASSVSALPDGLHAAPLGRRAPGWVIWASMAVLTALGTLFGWQVLGRSEPPQLFNTTLPPPADAAFYLRSTRPGPATISPDGSMVAYSVRLESGSAQLYVRRLDSPDATAMSGTDGASYPFWSPDSRFIGFLSDDNKLKKIAVAGGPPVTLCAADNLKGGTWNRDGVILFAPDHQSGIHKVPATGGDPVAVTTIPEEGDENSHRHPRFLPDGRQFIFLARVEGSAATEHRVYLGSLDGGEPTQLTTSQVAAEYSAGHLLTVREGILLATPFDPSSGNVGDNGVPLVEDILLISGAACGVFSPTVDGMLVYHVSTGSSERGLEWAVEGANQPGLIGEPGEMFRPRISPDGTQAIVEVVQSDIETTDLWLVNLETGLRSRFTFDAGDEIGAWWMPDGKEILYTAEVDSTFRIMKRPVEGTGGAVSLFETQSQVGVSSVSPDGKTLFLTLKDPETDWNIYSLQAETGELVPEVIADRVQGSAMISPDGRWLAFHAQTQGSWEIIVKPVSGGDRQWQIDREGGVYPFWSPDGSRLFYIEFSGDVSVVPVDGTGITFKAGAPQPFTRVGSPDAGGNYVSLHPDGERILHVGGEVSDDETGFLRLVTDWKRGLAN